MIGLVLAVMLFAINYGRIELVREVSFGETTAPTSIGRRPSAPSSASPIASRSCGCPGSCSSARRTACWSGSDGAWKRTRRRGSLPIDLRRVTGVDSSAVVSFVKVLRLAEASGFEVVFTGTSDPVRAQLARGGVEETPGLVSFEPDLDRGLERCEDALLMDLVPGERTVPVLEGLPPHLWEYFERVSLEEGTKLIEQGEAPDDVYVLESGRLRVELVTPGATQMRVSTVLPGVIVGEVALYT